MQEKRAAALTSHAVCFRLRCHAALRDCADLLFSFPLLPEHRVGHKAKGKDFECEERDVQGCGHAAAYERRDAQKRNDGQWTDDVTTFGWEKSLEALDHAFGPCRQKRS